MSANGETTDEQTAEIVSERVEASEFVMGNISSNEERSIDAELAPLLSEVKKKKKKQKLPPGIQQSNLWDDIPKKNISRSPDDSVFYSC